MTPDKLALARRAVACPRWRWLPGCTYVRTRPGGADSGRGRIEDVDYGSSPVAAVPDLSDPASLGCLLALVREAWASPDTHAERCLFAGAVSVCDAGWHVYAVGDDERREIRGSGATEAEALVVALEAAP